MAADTKATRSALESIAKDARRARAGDRIDPKERHELLIRIGLGPAEDDDDSDEEE